MRRLYWLVILVLLTGVSVSAAQINQEPVSSVLQVVDTDPLAGAELAPNGVITIYFDRELDCDTIAGAASIDPAIDGEFSCSEDNLALIFTPSETFQAAKTYTLTLSTDLLGADGSSLLEPFAFDVAILGTLAVVEVLPAPDSTEIAGNATLTVIFNRPVVPLVALGDRDDLPDPLTFSPDVEGEGEWLNTSIYVFRPDPAWAGGQQYTVAVTAGLEAVDGAVLESPYSWQFTVEMPRVVETRPLDAESDVRLDPLIQVRFNMPVDKASLEEHFFVRPQDAPEAGASGTFEWSSDGLGFGFRPEELLRLDTMYEVGFPADSVYDVTGQSALAADTWTFATVPLPSVVSTRPMDGATNVSTYERVMLYFSTIMDAESLYDRIVIDPEPWRAPDFNYYSYDNSLSVSFPVEPSTDYTITLLPGAVDVYGNTMESEFSFDYSTAPYDPEIELRVPGGVGLYNAYREYTQLFVTHRNVSQVDLNLYSVALVHFIDLMTGDSYWNPAMDYGPANNDLLRSWTIESVAPENARRYEMLDLASADSSGVAVVCTGAPPSRVSVGDTVIVITGPDPLRARTEPPDGEIVDLLYRDYVAQVVGGPVCADDMLWWEIRLRDETTAWIAEGMPDEYFIDLRAAAQIEEVTIDADFAEDERLRPGIYYLSASAPETVERGIRPQRHMLLVSTANLTVKASIDQVSVWATNIETGQSLIGVPIDIYGGVGKVLGSGVTSDDGFVQIDIERLDDLYVPILAVLDTGDHFAVSSNNWTDGVDLWWFNVPYNFYPQQYRLYLYTDRPVYRPDQPVYFRGVVRQKNDVNYTDTGLETVLVKIFDDDGAVIYERDLPVSEYGTFSDTFELADDARLGFYRIVVDLPSAHEWQSEGGSVSFNVAQYRLPEFQVEVAAQESEVIQNDTIAVEVDSSYFFGGPVTDARVEYSVSTRPYNFQYDAPGMWYSFVDMNYDGGPGDFFGDSGGLIASGTGVTDHEGQLVIEIPADLEDATQSQTFTIEAVVSDESEQAVAGRTSVVVHQGEVYIGVRPEGYVGTAGQDNRLEFIAVGWDGEPVADQEIAVEVYERRWFSVQEEDIYGRTTWSWDVEEIPLTSAEVTTEEDGTASYVFIPPTGGIYKVAITTRDDAGNDIRASTMLWISGAEYIAWRQQNSNRIDLVADRSSYEIGDTASILITSPFQGESEALVTVERGDILHVERITLDSNSYVYDLPITEEFAPNIYVSVLLVKGVDEENPVAGFRMGLVQLDVDTSRRELTIDISTDVERAGPRDTVTYTVRTTDYTGTPVPAEVGVGLTDLAALSLAEPNSVPILSYFYGLQELQVRTALPLTISTDQITQEVLDTVKGGGGGGEMGGIFDIREEFVDTAYWQADLVTDENGEATFEVTLPDNLTTWRLDARGVTAGADGDMLVGQDTFDLLSTRPLLIRPVTPRFFVVGDEVVLGAVVNNNTENPQVVTISVEGEGLTFSGDLEHEFIIPAGARQRANWPVTVNDVANVDLTFYVISEDEAFADASKPPLGLGDERLLPVYRYEAPEIVGTGGVLREAQTVTEAISLPRRFEVTQGELTINIEPSLAAAAVEGLDYLRNYPYSSIETVVSRLLPNVQTIKALQSLSVEDEELFTDLNREIQFALQRLYAHQHVDGGWGWFVREESNALVTAYALIGLVEAQDAGYVVEPNVIRRAQEFLQTQFVAPGRNIEAWRLDRQAFILYALAHSGAPDVGRTATLYDSSRDRLSIFARALMAITFDRIGDNSGRIDTLISGIVNDAVVSANGTHWEENSRDWWNWNTNTRTTAIVLQMLTELRPESELIPSVVRWLMVARSADAWETTQETAWAVGALTRWMVITEELAPTYEYALRFNDEMFASAQTSPDMATDVQTLQIGVAQMLQDQANRLTLTRTEGDGNLYYTAYLRVFQPVPEIEPVNRGIVVERHYTLLNDEDRNPITEARIGDVVQVRLTIIAPNNLHYVVVEDPIPAGADGIDPNLDTSQQIGTQPGLDSSDPLSRGWGWWWFSNIEFRDEKVVLHSTYLPAGTYEYVYTIRPGLEGVFNVMPPTAHESYFPDVFGRGSGSLFTILPGE